MAAADACAAMGAGRRRHRHAVGDEALLARLCDSGALVCLAEQNNGFILQNLQRLASRLGGRVDWSRVRAINTLDVAGRPQFIHSGTYEELLQAFRLSPPQIAQAIRGRLEEAR